MTWKIGRCGTDVTLRDPSTWDANGNRASISGYLNAATQADVNVLREQLLGYADNPDEEVVPVTWTVDSRVDGFYRVMSVQVSDDPSWRHALTLPYRLELERVPGFAAPGFQSALVGTLRTNNLSITTGIPHIGLPGAVTAYHDGTLIDSFVRDSADGDVAFIGGNAVAGPLVLVARYFLPASAALVGAAKIEVGDTLRTVVGSQISDSPLDWRLSNGLVRVTPNAATPGEIDVAHFDGAQWETAKSYKWTQVAGALEDLCEGYTSITVLRNSPSACIVRLACDFGDFGTSVRGRTNLDLMLRRGSRYVELTVTSDSEFDYIVERSTAEAATAITGGIRATSNDAGGNRYVLLTTASKTNDLVQGGFETILSPGGSTHSFAIGSEIAGSSAAEPDRAADISAQYFFAESEQEATVGR